ncbi:AAA family ATPase [Luteolibacter sp. SL250]|uniref:AAA family ATPase n=1 Tax=Luteolibacter sp. SL250 TaxID=2995170 RepID=UPI00226F691B|nr:AAA family ATPase [Luteolibacter sp. SL250]WAC21098.1 AAA family ATPase [Luteolibacter sp. SL250]
MQNQLITYLRAGHPGLVIITHEEVRGEAEISSAVRSCERRLLVWSSSDGWVDAQENRSHPCPDPLDALQWLEGQFTANDPRKVAVMRDLQLHLDQSDPLLVRRLKDLLRMAKTQGHCLILLGCRSKLPDELSHEFTTLDLPLPGADQLRVVLDGILSSAGLPASAPDELGEILSSAQGLTTTEAENAFALSVVEAGKPIPLIIAREKARTLKSGGLVEAVDAKVTLEQIGGLDLLKQWLVTRSRAFSREAQGYGLPVPKGLLIVGIPGTGKSLTAKATAAAFGIPLLRLDMGRVFGGIVGQSESNLRSVIRTAEAISPCVLWIDEIEKGFSGGHGGGTNDGGTSSRVFGSFLSWMQEKEKPVFVVATANDVSKLPPEFLRKGRFDELFFVDLPSRTERSAIWDIVIRKYARSIVRFDCVTLSRATDQYTGAEIEAVFVEALHHAFEEGRDVTEKDVFAAIGDIIPMATLMDGEIGRLRHWAKGRAREAASKVSPTRRTRRIQDN